MQKSPDYLERHCHLWVEHKLFLQRGACTEKKFLCIRLHLRNCRVQFGIKFNCSGESETPGSPTTGLTAVQRKKKPKRRSTGVLSAEVFLIHIAFRRIIASWQARNNFFSWESYIFVLAGYWTPIRWICRWGELVFRPPGKWCNVLLWLLPICFFTVSLPS